MAAERETTLESNVLENVGPKKVDTHYSGDVFAAQYVIVEDFVLHLAYYRALSNGMKRFTIESNFLAACAMANLYVAALNWCKVFGSNDNEVHWKKLGPKDEKKLTESFRNGLLSEEKITTDEWLSCWKGVKKFRDEYVAHRAIGKTHNIPAFDLPLRVAFFYDRWIRKVIAPDTLNAPKLSQEYDKALENAYVICLQILPSIQPLVVDG